MKFGSVVTEAFRNVSTGASGALVWLAIAVAVGAGTYLSDTIQAVQVLHTAYAYDEHGGSTIQLRSERAVDADRCVALGSVPGVRSAVALRFTDAVIRPTVRPDNPVPLVEAAGDAAWFLDAAAEPGAGLLLPDSLANVIGVGRGSTLELTSGEEAEIRGTYRFPEDGRDGRLASSAVAETTDRRPFDECWIHVWPLDEGKLDLLLYSADPGPAGAALPEVTQLNTTLGTNPAFNAQFVGRGTQLIAAVGAGLLLLIGFAAVWLRRLELSTSMQLGVRKPALMTQHALECLAWAFPAGLLLWSIGLTIIATSARPPDVSTLLGELTMQALVATLATVIGAVASVLAVNPTLQYAYLKSRG